MLKYIQKTVYTTYPLILPKVKCHQLKKFHTNVSSKMPTISHHRPTTSLASSHRPEVGAPLVHWESTWVLVGRVGGWSHKPTHLKKYARQIGSSPQVEGVNMINIWKLPPYGETTYNKASQRVDFPRLRLPVWGWFHMVGWPPKNLPNLYRLWTRNLETNLCRWLGFVDVYYFLKTKPPFKLRSWWRPNPKLATSLMIKKTAENIAPEKWCNRKMNFPNFFPKFGMHSDYFFSGFISPVSFMKSRSNSQDLWDH